MLEIHTRYFYENNTFQHLKKDEMLRQDSEFFGDLMFKKFELIYQSLLVFDYVIYIDSDIVIKNDFTRNLDYLSSMLMKKINKLKQ